MMTQLDAALLKLEGALDYTIDPRVRTLIDVAQQAIDTARHLMEEMPQELEGTPVACMGEYQRAA
jgi:hypothetical protein